MCVEVMVNDTWELGLLNYLPVRRWPVWRTSDHTRDPRDNRHVGGYARGGGVFS